MEWLAILGLAAMVWRQSGRITALTRRLSELEHPKAGAAPEAPPLRQAAPQPAALEPLLLDTPIPEASNDREEEPAAPMAPPPPIEALPPLPDPAPRSEPRTDQAAGAVPHARQPPPPQAARGDRRSLEKWLAEKAFAWLGGAVLAFGGIFFASVAVQQGWFTPPMQLASALVFGAGLVGAGEWARRRGNKRPPGHPLVAAMLAGAGVVTFYAAFWAAHGLYNFIGAITTGGLLALCAMLLGALSLRHGQALGVLAVALALLAPPFASMGLWPTTGLTLYVSAVGASGFALAVWRRWAWVAAASLTGLYFWFAAAIVTAEISRALMMASLAVLGGFALAYRKPLEDEAPARLSWSRARTDMPAIALGASSVLLIWAWVATAALASGSVARAAWVGAMFVVLAAAAVRARVAAPVSFAISAGALVLGFAAYLIARVQPPGADFYPFILFAAAVTGFAAMFARPHRHGRILVAASGAIGAGLLAILAAFTRADWRDPSAWIALFSVASILFFIAWRSASDAHKASHDRAVGYWAGVGAALVLLGVESAFTETWRTAAHAGAALAFAAGYASRGWTILRYAMLSAAALALAHAFSADVLGAALTGALPLGAALLVLGIAIALLFAASALISRTAPRAYAGESLSSASILLCLLAGFLVLRWIAAGGVGAPLDPFTEASLRALALIAAGHVVLPRSGQETGLIARWRGHVLMAAGLYLALTEQALATHPWWGFSPGHVTGPLILDALALAFAAPAALGLAAANRLYTRQRNCARLFAGAGGVLALIWIVSEVRRIFHGAEMATAPTGLFETACYGLILLAGALVATVVSNRRMARHAEGPFTQDLAKASEGSALAGIGGAAFLMLIARHPWWGGQIASLTGDAETALAALSQGVAALLALAIAGTSRSARLAAALAAAVFALSFGHCLLRWAYHRGLMDDDLALSGLESIAHTLWPLALTLAASALSSLKRDIAAPWLADLRAIWGAALWPALAFAAFGLWFAFNPWWGWTPAPIDTSLRAMLALGGFGAASWMSAQATHVSNARWAEALAPVSTCAVAGHLFVAATLSVRWLFHPDSMAAGAVENVEMWIYSAAWALFGAGAFGLGQWRNEALLRWLGLGLLLITTAKVFLFDMGQLSGVIRVGSFVGLGAVLLAIAWAARRASSAQTPAE